MEALCLQTFLWQRLSIGRGPARHKWGWYPGPPAQKSQGLWFRMLLLGPEFAWTPETVLQARPKRALLPSAQPTLPAPPGDPAGVGSLLHHFPVCTSPAGKLLDVQLLLASCPFSQRWAVSGKAFLPLEKSPRDGSDKKWRAVKLLALLTNWTLNRKGRNEKSWWLFPEPKYCPLRSFEDRPRWLSGHCFLLLLIYLVPQIAQGRPVNGNALFPDWDLNLSSGQPKAGIFFFTALGLCCGTQAFLWLQRTASLVVARGL